MRLEELCGFAPAVLDPAAVTRAARHADRRQAAALRPRGHRPSRASARTRKTAGKRTKELQDLLGEIHDCDVQLPRVEALVAELRDADAGELRLRAGDAPDLDPALAARLPHARRLARAARARGVHARAPRPALRPLPRRSGATSSARGSAPAWSTRSPSGPSRRREPAVRRASRSASGPRCAAAGPAPSPSPAPSIAAPAFPRPSALGPAVPGARRPSAREPAARLSEAEAGAASCRPPEDPFPAPRESLDLADADLSFNRELSWLDFNERVLQLAEDPASRCSSASKFCAIYASNLDEFFMVRVAGLHDQVEAGITEKRRAAASTRPRRSTRCARASSRSSSARRDCFGRATCARRSPSTGSASSPSTRSPEDQRPALDERFQRQIFPVLTPLAVGLGRPFPYISNLSLSLAVLLRDPETDQTVFARVKVPKEMLPRFVPLGEGERDVRPARGRDRRQPRRRSSRAWRSSTTAYFRVTRDADFDDLRRGRRPAAGGRGRAAPPPLRRGRAARGRRRR